MPGLVLLPEEMTAVHEGLTLLLALNAIGKLKKSLPSLVTLPKKTWPPQLPVS